MSTSSWIPPTATFQNSNLYNFKIVPVYTDFQNKYVRLSIVIFVYWFRLSFLQNYICILKNSCLEVHL